METKYKDSGIPWIGMIPSDWIILPIKRVKDKTHPYPIGDGDHGSIKPEDYIDEGIPYIRVQNMSWGGPIIMENIAYISEKVNELNKKSELHPNDILVAKTGATIGKTCIIPSNMPKANTTSSVGKVTVGKDFSSKYIFYLLGSEVCIRQMWLKAGQKSAQPGFNIDELVDFKIPIPQDLPTQQRIADFLDRKCAEIDELAALSETMIAELKRYKQSVITEVVTKGLDPNVPMKDSGVEWIGEIPKGWEVAKMNNICSVITDFVASGSFESLRINVPYLDTPDYAMLVRTADLSGSTRSSEKVYISEHSYNFLRNSNLFGGEVVLPNIGASVGDVYIVPQLYKRMSLAPNSIMFKTNGSDKYYYYYFFSRAGKQSIFDICQSTAQAKFNKTELRNLRVLLPPLTEQRDIADCLDRKWSTRNPSYSSM